MKVLLDNGVISSSNFLVAASREQQVKWGKTVECISIDGFKRADLDHDPDQQREKDALFTIGRLVRAGRISLHTYSELSVENWRRGRGSEPLVNALSKCEVHKCPSAIERSKIVQTIDMKEWLAKGGKSDRKKGLPFSHFNQAPYFKWLSLLSPDERAFLVNRASMLNLDDFEVASLHDLPWFQTLSRVFGGDENLPDCFHVWTARRNELDVFLTIEKKLPRSIQQIEGRRTKAIDLSVAVLRPTGLLQLLGITEIDAVPIEPGRFYTYMEISEINDRLLHS
jgi:hypothetical protein